MKRKPLRCTGVAQDSYGTRRADMKESGPEGPPCAALAYEAPGRGSRNTSVAPGVNEPDRRAVLAECVGRHGVGLELRLDSRSAREGVRREIKCAGTAYVRGRHRGTGECRRPSASPR